MRKLSAVKKSLLLGHVAQNTPEFDAQLSDVRAVEGDLPAIPTKIVGDEVHHGAFSCAVGAQDSVNSRAEGIGKTVQRYLFSVFLCDVFQLQFHRPHSFRGWLF